MIIAITNQKGGVGKSTTSINIAAERIKPFFAQLLIYFSIAYSSTLFSYTNKPPSIQNNFPALMVMLMILTFFSLATNLDSTKKHSNSKN